MTSKAEWSKIINGELRDNELTAHIAGSTADTPFAAFDSTMRMFMVSSMKTQIPPVDKPSAPYIFTGYLKHFGDYTGQIRMPEDAQIIKCIPRHPGYKQRGARKNTDRLRYPSMTVLYMTDGFDAQGNARHEFGYVDIHRFMARSKQFGAETVLPNWNGGSGSYNRRDIPKDTVLAQSSSIDRKLDLWNPGIAVNTCSMTIPEVGEDSVMVSDHFIEAATMTCVEKHTISYGKKRFGLNIHGDYDTYKVIPDIGERVGGNGLLFAAREYDERMAPVMMSRAKCRMVDYDRDYRIVVEPYAEVVDVRVYRKPKPESIRRSTYMTPKGMGDQLDRYCESDIKHYREILDTYNETKRKNWKSKFSVRPEFNDLYDRARVMAEGMDDPNIIKRYMGEDIDEWVAEVTISYKMRPGIGHKISGWHGNKGVVSCIRERSKMPVNAAGDIADVVECPSSVAGRMITGQPLERELGASQLATSRRIREMYKNGSSLTEIAELMADFYNTISEDILPFIGEETEDGFKISKEDAYEVAVGNDDIRIPLPPGVRFETDLMIPRLIAKYPGEFGKIEFHNMFGVKRTSKRPILIGPQYIIPLEKHGQRPAAAANGLLNYHGTQSKLNDENKKRSLVNRKTTRFGEDEINRAMANMMGAVEAVDVMDRSTHQQARRSIVEAIFEAENPVDIENAVPRDKVIIGGNRVVETIDHVNMCYGRKLVRK